MSRPLTWKRFLAAPAVLSLALGGALLTAGPASAAPGDPVSITSPAEGSIATSRTVTVTGLGSDGDDVVLSVASGDVPDQTVTVAAGGAWTADLEFGDDADIAQTITATQDVIPGTTDSVTIQLPVVVVPPVPFTVTSPVDGADIDSRFVDFEGTAPAGSTVTATVDGLEGYGSIFADDEGNFFFEGYFPFQLGNEVTVVITATLENGEVSDPETRVLNLLAPIPAPVILTPRTGSSIVGGNVTITGTGTAGTTVIVGIIPENEALLNELDFEVLFPTAVVAANGTFSVSTTLPLGNYSAIALLTETPIESVDSEVLSLESNEVAFSLVAAAAPAAVLAATGPTSTGFAAPAAALLLTGLLMVVASRRRRGQLV